MLKYISFFITFFIFIFTCFLPFEPRVSAATVDELRSKITEKSLQIVDIEKEIAIYEKELQKVGGERKTLENAISELNLTRKKLLSDVSLTEKKIEQASYSLERIGIAIEDKEKRIARNTTILAEAVRTMDEIDRQSTIETILNKDSLSDVWTELDQLSQVQSTVQSQLHELKELKSDLIEQHSVERKTHENLTVYKSKLSGQQKVIDENKRAKDSLLNVTKSKEAEYQKLIAQKQAARKQFETDLQAYEGQLQYAANPSTLPQKGTQVLIWPVEAPVITQGYGLTSFAQGGAYGYDKSGRPNPHRGVDFKASVGTPVLAATGGTVRDAVNMDAFPGCYSYGRWVLVDHDNGLSTMYAHLSVISVSAGEYVKPGQIVGYAGSSGYATGPHLHFQVFDRDAVQVSQFTWSVGCKQARVPYAPYEAYLNPMNYLPGL